MSLLDMPLDGVAHAEPVASPAGLHWSQVIELEPVAPLGPKPALFSPNKLVLPCNVARSRYDPLFCEWVVDEMAQGYSLSAFCARIGTTLDHIRNWRSLFPDFDSACERAKALQLRFYESKHIHVCETGGVGSQGQASWRGMLNAGPHEWKDKREVEHSGSISLSAMVESSLKPMIDVTPVPQADSDSA